MFSLAGAGEQRRPIPKHDSLGGAVAPVAEDTHTHPVVRWGAPERRRLHDKPAWFRKKAQLFHQLTHPNQLFMWSEAALAADIAELSFLAAITAAPRCKIC